jgi:hypothetical protein
MAVREILWQTPTVQCVVMRHPEAQSLEVQIIEDRKVVARRWFDRGDAAAAYVIDLGRAHGAVA